MYVSYELFTDGSSITWVAKGVYPWLPWHAGTLSECVWMVPGTVDPMED